MRGQRPEHEDFLAHIRSRAPPAAAPAPAAALPAAGLGTPFWVDYPDFDIHRHVRRVTLPAPGTEAQFQALVGELLAPPLDRSKPLWELILVEGFEDERFAIVYKTHHAMADGISAVDIGMLLFDVEPKSEPAREEAPWTPGPDALAGAPSSAAPAPGSPPRSRRARPLAAARAARSPRRARKRAADGLAGLWEVTWNLARPAPKVPFNTEIGPGRELLPGRPSTWPTSSRSRTPRRHRQRRHPGRRRRRPAPLAAERDVAVDGLELKALVPVSIRTENEHGELGNKLTAMRGPLPVGIADPVERLRAVSAAMDALKASKQPLGAEAIWGLNDWFRDFAPPVLLGPTAAINFSTRLFNLLVTNFPGPQVPFYVLGRELTAVYPVGFLAKRPRPGDRDPQLQRPGRLRPARRPRRGPRRRADRRPTSAAAVDGARRSAAQIASPAMATSWQEMIDLGSRESANASAEAEPEPSSAAASSSACARASRKAARR